MIAPGISPCTYRLVRSLTVYSLVFVLLFWYFSISLNSRSYKAYKSTNKGPHQT